MQTDTTTMKAWTASRLGKPSDVLSLRADAPIPAPPKEGEVTIKVTYVSLNPGDFKMMEHWIPWRGALIPGMDFVGEIVQLGPGNTDLKPGMIVGGAVSVMFTLRGRGTLAEYVVLPTHAVVECPPGLDKKIAGGLLGVAGQTSATVLRAAGLHEGQAVLLNGASGGVGCILTQALSSMGMKVTGICSGRNESLVKRLGAHEVIDYTAHKDLYSHLSSICTIDGSFDAIIDCVGNMDLYHRSSGFLKPRGWCISIEGTIMNQLRYNYLPTILGGRDRFYKSIMAYPSGDLAAEAAGWYKAGWIKEIPVDSVFTMDGVIEVISTSKPLTHPPKLI